MEYNRDALIALFEKKLLGFGYQTPSNEKSLGSLNINNEDFKLLSGLDDKALVVAATYDWTFDDYDFDDMPEDDIDDNIEFDIDEEEQIIRFIATIPFDDIKEDNVISQVGGVANAISFAYDCLSEDAEYKDWLENYDFTPITYSEFDCPVCGSHISYKPGTCPNCGEVYDADNEDIECGECGSLLDEIVCPKCGGDIREWDIEQYMQLSDAKREKLTKAHRINHSLDEHERQMPQSILAAERDKNYHLGLEIKSMLPAGFEQTQVYVDAQWQRWMKVRLRLKAGGDDLCATIEADDWREAIKPLLNSLPEFAEIDSLDIDAFRTSLYQDLADQYIEFKII